jgi:hypothetical protein
MLSVKLRHWPVVRISFGPSGSLESRTATAVPRSAISTQLPLPPL